MKYFIIVLVLMVAGCEDTEPEKSRVVNIPGDYPINSGEIHISPVAPLVVTEGWACETKRIGWFANDYVCREKPPVPVSNYSAWPIPLDDVTLDDGPSTFVWYGSSVNPILEIKIDYDRECGVLLKGKICENELPEIEVVLCPDGRPCMCGKLPPIEIRCSDSVDKPNCKKIEWSSHGNDMWLCNEDAKLITSGDK